MLTFETERALVARTAAEPPTARGRVARPTARRLRLRRGCAVTDTLEPPVHVTPLTDTHRQLAHG